MAKLEYFIVSEIASVDVETNQTTLVNVLEELSTLQFPLILPRCAAVAVWRIEAGDAEKVWLATMRLMLPGEAPLDFKADFRIQANTHRHRLIQKLVGLPIKAAGDLKFELLLNGEHQAEHVVTVSRTAEDDPRLVAWRIQ